MVGDRVGVAVLEEVVPEVDPPAVVGAALVEE